MRGRGRVGARPSATLPALMGSEPLSHALTGSGLLSVVVEGSDAAEGGEDSEEASEVVAGGAGHGLCVECPLIIGMGVGLCGDDV